MDEWQAHESRPPKGGTYKAIVSWCECGWRSAIENARESQAVAEASLRLHREHRHPTVEYPTTEGAA